MKRLGFILFIAVAYPLSLLPMRALYVLSDITCFILYRVIKYRVNVVTANLKNSFPEKSDAELHRIAKAFYKNLSDIIIEALKMISISKEEVMRRNRFDTISVLQQFKSQNKSVIGVLGHFGNWEWGGLALSISSPMPVNTIYRPLSNPYFNRFLFRLRSRFGINLVEMDNIYKTLLKQTVPAVTAFIADQSPPNTKATYWTTFLSQDTPVFLGVEKMALRLKTPLVFFYSLRVKRGHYVIYCNLLAEDISQFSGEYQLTELHTRFLEQLIRKHPDQWLWSHKRWKHKRIS